MKQRRENELVIKTGSGENLTKFTVPPVSMKGRTMLVNIGGVLTDPTAPGKRTRASTTFKVTNTNEDIYFNQQALDELTEIRYDQGFKSYRDVIRMAKGGGSFNVNWVLFSQNIFPSLRNEFISGTERPFYQNCFWADEHGTSTANDANKFPAGDQAGGRAAILTKSSTTRAEIGRMLKPFNSMRVNLSQSAWVLDPSVHFLTRSVADNQGPGSQPYPSFDGYYINNVFNGFSGELQNEYNGFFTASINDQILYVPPSALYARAHVLDTPTSVVSPQGPRIPETGSVPNRSASFVFANRLNIPGSGQALWEAGAQAGYLMKTSSITIEEDSMNGIIFVTASSSPWWDNYRSFKEDLDLKAKGFAIIPEFRMSRHARHMKMQGTELTNLVDIDHYELPHSNDFNPNVGIRRNVGDMPPTSSGTRHENFYKDYSNSDFLKNFLRIKRETLLKADQIRLSATGAIRFNPYDGFYPAQRTVQLVSEFSMSFGQAFMASASVAYTVGGVQDPNVVYGKDGRQAILIRKGKLVQNTIMQPMFAPGILYNSIKSGMAVDYPLVHDPTKIRSGYYGRSAGDGEAGNNDHNFAMTITNSRGATSVTTAGPDRESGFLDFSGSTGYRGGMFWDRRLPFEAIIRPKSFLPGYKFLQMETHPSMSTLRAFYRCAPCFDGQTISASMHFPSQRSHVQLSDLGDNVYSMAARNFFGETANFFLKDSSLTTLRSKTVTNDLQFSSGEVYMARIKLKRSHNGARTYQHEFDSFGKTKTGGVAGETGATSGSAGIAGRNCAYGLLGARAYLSASKESGTGQPLLLQAEFPLPQDPKMNPDFKETFTMYSRPTAFGPPVAGRPTGSYSTKEITVSGSTAGDDAVTGQYTASFEKSAMDSFNGYNPAFTPPYTNGESWVDLIFRPSASVAYDLERILAETQTYCWRFDTGPIIKFPGNEEFNNNLPTIRNQKGVPSLVPVQQRAGTSCGEFNPNVSPNDDNTIPSPYDGFRLNVNSMQITSSLDIFGVERILEQTQGPDGTSKGQITNKTVGQKWLIRPKWESPMLNFNDEGPRPISAEKGTLTLPLFGSASVPRGMWHQFGTIPTSPDIGVFMEITEIPLDWLKNHYMVNHEPSIYNNFDVVAGRSISSKVKSLSKLCGFDQTNNEVRLGELKRKATISEAIVAIPYITRTLSKKRIAAIKRKNPKNTIEQTLKQFIKIPKPRWRLAVDDRGTTEQVGESVRRLADAMDKYIFPPEFDALNNKNIDPVAMYVLEFDYEFDRDDLSYIWQNTAPRDYKKLSFQKSTVSHNLANNELINARLLNNPNLRWMVFKVKQRAKTDYYDLLVDQAGQATSQINQIEDRDREYEVQFNWPYDYLSFVELVKLDVEILMKPQRTRILPTEGTTTKRRRRAVARKQNGVKIKGRKK